MRISVTLLATIATLSSLASCGDLAESTDKTQPPGATATSVGSTTEPGSTDNNNDPKEAKDRPEESGPARYSHIEWGMYTGNPPHRIPKEVALDAMVNELFVQGIKMPAPVAVEHADKICDFAYSGGDYYDLIDEIKSEGASGREAMPGVSNSDLISYFPLAIGAYCPAAGLRIFGDG